MSPKIANQEPARSEQGSASLGTSNPQRTVEPTQFHIPPDVSFMTATWIWSTGLKNGYLS